MAVTIRDVAQMADVHALRAALGSSRVAEELGYGVSRALTTGGTCNLGLIVADAVGRNQHVVQVDLPDLAGDVGVARGR